MSRTLWSQEHDAGTHHRQSERRYGVPVIVEIDPRSAWRKCVDGAPEIVVGIIVIAAVFALYIVVSVVSHAGPAALFVGGPGNHWQQPVQQVAGQIAPLAQLWGQQDG